MRKFTWSFAIWCLIGGVHTPALACEATYDPVTKEALIPCVAILGGTQYFGVVLESTGGNNFVLTSIEEFAVENPAVVSLKILTMPFPVAIVYGYYSAGCGRAYDRPSFVQTDNNIDIRLKAQYPLPTLCTANIILFAEAVTLPTSVSSQTYTYSVNGVSITPSY